MNPADKSTPLCFAPHNPGVRQFPFKKNGESLGSFVGFSRIRPRVVLGWVGEICHNPWSARHATWLCIGLFQQCNRFCAMPIELATRDFPWLQIEFPSSAQQRPRFMLKERHCRNCFLIAASLKAFLRSYKELHCSAALTKSSWHRS